MKFFSNNRSSILLFVAGLLILFGSSCSQSYQLRNNEYIDLYNRGSDFRPQAYVRQFHPDSAYIYIMFRAEELQHRRKSDGDPYIARMEVDIVLKNQAMSNFEDTLKYMFKNEQVALKNEAITARVTIPVRDTLAYELSVKFKDLQKEVERTEYIFLNTNSDDLRYMDVRIEGEPKPFCSCAQGQRVELRPYWGIADATWSVIEVDREPAPLPFSMTNNAAPAERLIAKLDPERSEDGWYALSCPQGNGIKLDFASNRKWMIPVFAVDYPMIESIESLTAPLRYITTNDEYDDLTFSLQKKKDVSSFWLGCAADELRAKKLLATYYKRVEEANIYFTDTHNEGWKSDRGLVYIAYGSPNRIIRESGKEVWYYSVENADFGLQMHFIQGKKVKLDRSLDYRQSWYLTVDAWRNGKIANL